MQINQVTIPIRQAPARGFNSYRIPKETEEKILEGIKNIAWARETNKFHYLLGAWVIITRNINHLFPNDQNGLNSTALALINEVEPGAAELLKPAA